MSLRVLVSYCGTLLIVSLARQAVASPTQMVHNDTPQCDPLFIPANVEELGHFAEFPADEALEPESFPQSPFIPCPQTNDPSLPDLVVGVRNLTGREWKEVWYVADPETSISSFDGEANQIPHAPLREAFRIDRLASDPLGSHHSLFHESIINDGIFQIGEFWQFTLQDYTNSLGLPPGAINSIGVGDASTTPTTGIVESSGSIIAFAEPVPEPTGLALTLLGLLTLAAMRRR